MKPQLYFRVARRDLGNEGLWYDSAGNHTGLIHNELKFCSNHGLPMPYDERLIGWLSAATSLEELFVWFTREDIAQLEQYGYSIVVYTATEFWQYVHPHYTHMVISQQSSRLVHTIHVADVPYSDIVAFEESLCMSIEEPAMM